MSKQKAVADNTKKRKATPASWRKGESGNPKGAPRHGESWASVLTWASNLTGEEASRIVPPEMAREFRKLGGLQLKQAISLRIMASLLFEPGASLFNAVMDRVDGKVPTPTHEMSDDEWRDWMKKNGYTDADIDELIWEFAAAMGGKRGDASGGETGATAGDSP